MLTCKGIKKLNIIKMIWKFQSYQVSKIFFWFCIRLKWTFTFYFVIFYLNHKCLNKINSNDIFYALKRFHCDVTQNRKMTTTDVMS